VKNLETKVRRKSEGKYHGGRVIFLVFLISWGDKDNIFTFWFCASLACSKSHYKLVEEMGS
jgi:hypothetical protein